MKFTLLLICSLLSGLLHARIALSQPVIPPDLISLPDWIGGLFLAVLAFAVLLAIMVRLEDAVEGFLRNNVHGGERWIVPVRWMTVFFTVSLVVAVVAHMIFF